MTGLRSVAGIVVIAVRRGRAANAPGDHDIFTSQNFVAGISRARIVILAVDGGGFAALIGIAGIGRAGVRVIANHFGVRATTESITGVVGAGVPIVAIHRFVLTTERSMATVCGAGAFVVTAQGGPGLAGVIGSAGFRPIANVSVGAICVILTSLAIFDGCIQTSGDAIAGVGGTRVIVVANRRGITAAVVLVASLRGAGVVIFATAVDDAVRASFSGIAKFIIAFRRAAAAVAGLIWAAARSSGISAILSRVSLVISAGHAFAAILGTGATVFLKIPLADVVTAFTTENRVAVVLCMGLLQGCIGGANGAERIGDASGVMTEANFHRVGFGRNKKASRPEQEAKWECPDIFFCEN